MVIPLWCVNTYISICTYRDAVTSNKEFCAPWQELSRTQMLVKTRIKSTYIHIHGLWISISDLLALCFCGSTWQIPLLAGRLLACCYQMLHFLKVFQLGLHWERSPRSSSPTIDPSPHAHQTMPLVLYHPAHACRWKHFSNIYLEAHGHDVPASQKYCYNLSLLCFAV